MIKFLSDDIWSTIKTLAEKSKKTKIAVAYFGNRAANKLKLKRGDTLILAISLRNVKAGQINPYEVEKLYKKGVDIYNVENLHSKIFHFGNKVIVGSANISENSEERLIETGVLTNDSKVVDAASKFIEDHSIEKVEQDYLEVCKKNYKAPKFFGAKNKKATGNRLTKKLSKVWVLSTKSSNANDDISEKAEERLYKKITDSKNFTTEHITFPPSSKIIREIKEGDILFEIFNQPGKAIVFAPKRAIGIAWNRPKTHKVLVVEERVKPKYKSWNVVKKELNKQGVKMITNNSNREIISENTKEILLNCFKK